MGLFPSLTTVVVTGKGVTLYLPGGGGCHDFPAKGSPPVSEILSRLDDARFRPPPGYSRGGPVAARTPIPLRARGAEPSLAGRLRLRLRLRRRLFPPCRFPHFCGGGR